MVLGRRVLLKHLRRLYWMARNDPVDDDLRGWSWDHPPMKPRAYLGLGVYEVASRYCPTRRDIWLRRKQCIKGYPTRQMNTGKIIHGVFDAAVREASKRLLDGFPGTMIYEELMWSARRIVEKYTGCGERWAVGLFKTLVLTLIAEAEIDSAVTGSEAYPLWFTEYRVDGSLLGLSSSLSVDALFGGVIVEVKYGRPMDFHKLGLAGYALALESSHEVPYDYGILVYVNGIPGNRPKIGIKPVYISNPLRRWFLEERDEIIDFLLADKEPGRPVSCSRNCPFYEVCNR